MGRAKCSKGRDILGSVRKLTQVHHVQRARQLLVRHRIHPSTCSSLSPHSTPVSFPHNFGPSSCSMHQKSDIPLQAHRPPKASLCTLGQLCSTSDPIKQACCLGSWIHVWLGNLPDCAQPGRGHSFNLHQARTRDDLELQTLCNISAV